MALDSLIYPKEYPPLHCRATLRNPSKRAGICRASNMTMSTVGLAPPRLPNEIGYSGLREWQATLLPSRSSKLTIIVWSQVLDRIRRSLGFCGAFVVSRLRYVNLSDG